MRHDKSILTLLVVATLLEATSGSMRDYFIESWSRKRNVTGLRASPDEAGTKFCWRVPGTASFFCNVVVPDDGASTNKTCGLKFVASNDATVLSGTIWRSAISRAGDRLLIGYYERRDILAFAEMYLLRVASLLDARTCRTLPLNDLTRLDRFEFATRHHVVPRDDGFDVIKVDAHHPHEHTAYSMFSFDRDGRAIGDSSTRLLGNKLFDKVIRSEAFARVRDPGDSSASLLYGIFELPLEKLVKVYRIGANGAGVKEWSYRTAP